MRRPFSLPPTAAVLVPLLLAAAAPLSAQQPVEVTLRSPDSMPVEGATGLEAAVIPVVQHYLTADPVIW